MTRLIIPQGRDGQGLYEKNGKEINRVCLPKFVFSRKRVSFFRP